MADLKFADTHNLVAFLSKPAESKGFEQIVDFLNANPIRYALTINPTIYISYIEQFWSTVKAKTVNGEVQLHALVDGKKIIITKSTISLHEEMYLTGLERAVTTATSLDAEQDKGNINKTQSKATPNEPSSLGTSSGGGPRRQEIMGDTIAQTRSENVSKHSNDPLLARDLLTKAFDAKTVNREVQLQSLVDEKKIIITESTVRRDLQLEDAEGVDCLPNATIFEQLTLMGKPKRKNTEIPQSSGPTDNVTNEAVNEEMDDNLVRAATTASSLEAEQDSGNIIKTRSKATLNEPSSPGTSSGGGPRCQETTGDTIAQTRLELKELMELCTNLQQRLLDLETTKTTQANEIASLKRRVNNLERRNKSRTHGLKRIYKVSSSRRMVMSNQDVVKIAKETVNAATTTVSTANTIPVSVAIINDVELTLAQALAELKSAKPKADNVVIQELEQAFRMDTLSLVSEYLKDVEECLDDGDSKVAKEAKLFDALEHKSVVIEDVELDLADLANYVTEEVLGNMGFVRVNFSDNGRKMMNDVNVEIHGVKFKADFVVLDYVNEGEPSIMFGRDFLATTKSQVDFGLGEIRINLTKFKEGIKVIDLLEEVGSSSEEVVKMGKANCNKGYNINKLTPPPSLRLEEIPSTSMIPPQPIYHPLTQKQKEKIKEVLDIKYKELEESKPILEVLENYVIYKKKLDEILIGKERINKKEFSEEDKVGIIEHDLPKKMCDPENYVLPVKINGVVEMVALVDTEASNLPQAIIDMGRGTLCIDDGVIRHTYFPKPRSKSYVEGFEMEGEDEWRKSLRLKKSFKKFLGQP
ncbi:hypothetical protein Tco_0554661 [Tanacetum coccineum]